MLQVRYSYTNSFLVVVGNHSLVNANNRRCFCVLNHKLKQRTKHHVQDGRPTAEFSLAATKQREVDHHDDITSVYWSVMTPLLDYWSE